MVFTQQKQVLPLAALFGSLLLLVSDTIGRLLPGNGEMPAGIIVAIIGAPYFLLFVNQKQAIRYKKNQKAGSIGRCESNCHLLGFFYWRIFEK